MAWTYDRKSRRYRDEATGRYLSPKAMVALRDAFTDRLKDRAADLAFQRAAGDLTQDAWERQMRALVKVAHIDMACLGRGGRQQMAPQDWGRVGAAIKEQYAFLGRFADETGTLSEAQTAARASMYVESATQAYERGRAAAWGISLPAYPGDGGTSCLSNCRCHWSIVEKEATIEATWTLGAAEHCPECIENAGQWAPLVMARAEA